MTKPIDREINKMMSKFVSIKCRCGKKINILKPSYSSREHFLKSHAHCRACSLEWHITIEGKIYAHPYQQSKKVVKAIQGPDGNLRKKAITDEYRERLGINATVHA